jgi:hypothetical protein
VLERASSNAVAGGAQLVEELQPKPGCSSDTRSPIRIREPIEDVTCGARPAWVSPILGKPLRGKIEMRFLHGDLARLPGDAIPKGL